MSALKGREVYWVETPFSKMLTTSLITSLELVLVTVSG